MEGARRENNIMVSVVKDAESIKTRDFDASEIFEVIRSGSWNIRAQIEKIRKTYQRELAAHGDHAPAKKAVDEAKKKLPGVLWSGTFTTRGKDFLAKYSGLICGDLDKLSGTQIKDVREKLSRDPHVMALFSSPSGYGLKVVFRAPADASKHLGSFRAIEQHVKGLAGVQIDESCKDLARLCFLSHDPGLFYNADAVEIEPLPEPENPRFANNGKMDLNARQRIAGELLGLIDWDSETSGVITCPGKHLHTTGDNVRDCIVYLDRVPTANCFHTSCRGILSGVNHELRARIGKAEHENNKRDGATSSQGANAENATDDQSEDPIDAALNASGLAALGSDSSMAVIEKAVRALGGILKNGDKVRRATIREAALRKLNEIGISAPGRLLDAALPEQGYDDNDTQGQTLVLADPEPWPDKVNGAELLDAIAGAFRRFVFLPPCADVVQSLWCLHAHALDAFGISPLLEINSPQLECGKSVNQSVMRRLAPRGLTTMSISLSGMFRVVEKFQPTLFVDEGDAFLEINEDLRGILNASHFKNDAFVVRVEGDDHEPRAFKTWCAKSIAMIGNLPPTLRSRSITIQMKRKTAKDKVEDFHGHHAYPELETLRRRAWRWAQDNLTAISDAKPSLPDELINRAKDNWSPLFAIAEVAGGEWPERCKAAALAFQQAGPDETSIAPVLLADLQDLFRDSEGESLSTEFILAALHKMDERPWAEWRKGKPMTAVQLARLLRPFGIRPKTIRVGDATAKGYNMGDCLDAFARYTPPSDPSHP